MRVYVHESTENSVPHAWVACVFRCVCSLPVAPVRTALLISRSVSAAMWDESLSGDLSNSGLGRRRCSRWMRGATSFADRFGAGGTTISP